MPETAVSETHGEPIAMRATPDKEPGASGKDPARPPKARANPGGGPGATSGALGTAGDAGGAAATLVPVLAGTPRTEVFAFGGRNREALTRGLKRVAELAPRLSDGELRDLACHTGRKTSHGQVRAGLTASSQDQLSHRARDALRLLAGLPPGRLGTARGVFAADGGAGRVVLLFPGEASPIAALAGARAGLDAGTYDRSLHPAIIAASLAGLRWLGRLGVKATAGVGHGVGEITGLVWAGCLSEPDASRLVAQRGTLLAAPAAHRTALVRVDTDTETAQRLCAGTSLVIAAYNGPRCHVLAGPESAVSDIRQRLAKQGIPARRLDSPHAFYSPAMSDRVAPLRSILRELAFRPPARRLISTVTGAELTAIDDIMLMLCKHLMSPIRFAEALDCARAGADLLVETGPGHVLTHFAADCCDVPGVSLAGARADEEAVALAAAALFAAGAADTLAPVFAGRAARPIDIWRERTFITGAGETSARAEAGPATTGPGQAGAPTTAAGQSRPRAAATRSAAGGAAGRPAPALAGQVRRVPDQAFAGVGPWVRCFTEEQRAAKPPQPPAEGRKWRLRKAGSDPLGAIAMQVFPDDPSAETVVTVLGGLTEPGACAVLLGAAREAVDAGRLVLIATEHSVTGFGASLRAEHPALGVTVIKTAPTLAGLEAAKRFAVAAPGGFREVALDGSGGAAEPAMATVVPGAEGTFPLGPADVVLVSGITSPGDLACATALASRGAALAVLAAPGPEDPRLAACLADLRAAGTRVSRKGAELTDPAQVAVAVRSLERGLGPVTAVVHAAAPGPAERCARLSESVLRGCLTSQEQRFGAVLSAIAPERLRVLVTFGSITARYGAPGRACEGLAGEMLAELARRRASELARCRALHVDWAPWAELDTLDPDPDAAMGVSVADGSHLLIAMLTTPDLPHRVAVHGRLGARSALTSLTAGAAPTRTAGGAAPATRTGGAAPATPASANTPAQATGGAAPATPASANTPAQATGGAAPATPASANTPAQATGGAAPATPASANTPGQATGGGALGMRGRFLDTVRVHYPGVELVVDTPLSLQADPYLNDYRMADLPVLPVPMILEAMAQAASALAGAPQRHATGVHMAFPVAVPAGEAVIRVCALRRGETVETVLRCAETKFRVDHARAMFGEARAPEADDGEAATPPASVGAGRPGRHTRRPGGADMPAGGIVDGTDLYGAVHFQAGRFRRIAFLPEVSSRGCRALVRGADDKPWFGAVPGPADVPMVLGSPGPNDASLQVLQSCLPHRRWQLDSCESASFSGDEARGAVEVRAVRRPPAAGEAAGTASGSWDVRVIDAAGQTLAAWTGVTLRDLGPLAPAEDWHPTLLAAALEARAAGLGIDPSLRATITCGRQPGTGRRAPGHAGGGPPAGAGITGAGAVVRSGDWWDRAVGRGPLDGFELTVRAARPVACRWQAVGSLGSRNPHDKELARLRNQLSACLPETAETVEARMITLAACLAALGRKPGAPCILGGACDSDWIVVRSSGVAAGCAITHISGVPATVVVSIASRVTEAAAMVSNPPGLPIPAGPPTRSGAPILSAPLTAPDQPIAAGSQAQEKHAPGKRAQEEHARGKAVNAQEPPPIRPSTVLQQNCLSSAQRSPRLPGRHGRSQQTACRFAA